MKNIIFILALGTTFLFEGCAHEQFITDARNPEVAVSAIGNVTYRGKIVDPEDLPGLLKDSGLTREDTIHIRIESGLKDYRHPYHLLGILVKSGFTRSVFVEDRRSSSSVAPEKKRSPAPAGTERIRYKN